MRLFCPDSPKLDGGAAISLNGFCPASGITSAGGSVNLACSNRVGASGIWRSAKDDCWLGGADLRHYIREGGTKGEVSLASYRLQHGAGRKLRRSLGPQNDGGSSTLKSGGSSVSESG